MKRLLPPLILALLTACATPASQTDTNADAARGASGFVEGIGRVGPDGAPPASLAERGIGGTGAPVSIAPAITADRGIGGTGIVGVVTGFGSVYVNGIEVEYDDTAAVDIDGGSASLSALRAGQLVVIQADGPALAPHAKTISVRTAVIGRIEALELGSGTLTIAGQGVSVPEGTWGANHFGLGDWVKVSGLRREDGIIVASRLDTAPPGTLLARGRVIRDASGVRIGTLSLTGPSADSVKDGQYVVVSGNYAAGHGQVSTVAADVVWPNPAAYFGAATNMLVVQAFVRVDKGSVSMNGVPVKSAPVVAGAARRDGIAVVSLQRQPDGSYAAVGLRYGDYKGRTDRPVHNGGGTSDSSQAPQRVARAATMPMPQPQANETGSATNPPVATVAVSSDPANVPAAMVDSMPSTPIVTRAMEPVSTFSTPSAGDAGSHTAPISSGNPAATSQPTPSSDIPMSSTTTTISGTPAIAGAPSGTGSAGATGGTSTISTTASGTRAGGTSAAVATSSQSTGIAATSSTSTGVTGAAANGTSSSGASVGSASIGAASGSAATTGGTSGGGTTTAGGSVAGTSGAATAASGASTATSSTSGTSTGSGATGGSGGGTAGVQSVPPSGGGSTGGSGSTGGLISSNTGSITSASLAKIPLSVSLAGQRAGVTRGAALAIWSSSTTPTVSLLTGAVTSVTTTTRSPPPAPSVAAVKPVATTASVTSATTTLGAAPIGTTSGKQSGGHRTR